MKEFAIIDSFFTWQESRDSELKEELLLGPGDDCAIFEPERFKGKLCVTTDTMVEGVHFFKGLDPRLLAVKALRVNLSDLSAMGAIPSFFTLSLVLDKKHAQEDFLKPFSEALHEEALEAKIALAGGNLSSGSEFSIAITAAGCALKPLRRDAARAGDVLAVAGVLGAPALYVEAGYGRVQVSQADRLFLEELFARPQRLTSFAAAAAPWIHAAIDISDGVAGDLKHILDKSRAGAKIDLEKLPAHPMLESYIKDPLARARLCLFGGGDYTLLFTASKEDFAKICELGAAQGTAVTAIGRVVSEPGLRYFKEGREICFAQESFDHFAS